MKIVTSQRTVLINGEHAVEWSRGRGDIGVIDIQNEFIEKRSTEELSIEDAELFANAILKACADAIDHKLKPAFNTK